MSLLLSPQHFLPGFRFLRLSMQKRLMPAGLGSLSPSSLVLPAFRHSGLSSSTNLPRHSVLFLSLLILSRHGPSSELLQILFPLPLRLFSKVLLCSFPTSQSYAQRHPHLLYFACYHTSAHNRHGFHCVRHGSQVKKDLTILTQK